MNLAILGDEETIRTLVKDEGSAREWSRYLSLSGSPAAIEVLMPYVLKEEPLVNRMVDDVVQTSSSHFFAAVIIPRILARNPVFNSSVAE